MFIRLPLLALAALSTLCLLIAGCGQSVPADAIAPSSSAGQVVNATAAPKLTSYAAARVAEQVSFGATPVLLNSLAQRGLEDWISDQIALPVSRMDAPAWVIDYNDQNQAERDRAFQWKDRALVQLPLTAPDQLRLRVGWALLQFVPANSGTAYGQVEYFNLLQRHALGNYGEFLRELSVHPVMGSFLDNVQNRPKSEQCRDCAPNENYARELMQLFSLGVVQLKPDGTTMRDAKGKALETYEQDDVEELARALTGWRFAPSNILLGSNWINAGKLMVPEDWASAHDRGAKRILGTDFPAGRDPPPGTRRGGGDADEASQHRAVRQPALDPALGHQQPDAAIHCACFGGVPRQRSGRGGRHESPGQGRAARPRSPARRCPRCRCQTFRQAARTLALVHGDLARTGLHPAP